MEKFDVYDKFGKKTGDIIIRGGGLQKGQYRLAVNAWIINNGRILLQKRASTLKSGPGKWAATSGGTIAGERPETTVIRECREELGLNFSRRDVIYLSRALAVNSYWIFSYAIHKKVDFSKIVLQKSEVEDVNWFTVDEIEDLIDAGEFFYTAKIWEYVKIYTEFWKNFLKTY